MTDAGFKPEKQVADIETVMAKKPDIIVSIPVDAVATAAAYKAAADKGVKLVFMDNVPKGFTAGKEYVSSVSADNYGNGIAAAHLMAKALGGKGEIGLVFHAADFFVTRQRYDGFKKTILEDYPDIKIVGEQGIGGPDFSGDAEKAAGAILTAHPQLNAIWAVWDVPAEGVMAAARAAGRDDLIVVNEDLGENVAIAMAKGEFIKGIASQRPYDQGVTEANLAGLRPDRQAGAGLCRAARRADHQGHAAGELAGDLPPAGDRQDQQEHEIAEGLSPQLKRSGGLAAGSRPHRRPHPMSDLADIDRRRSTRRARSPCG